MGHVDLISLAKLIKCVALQSLEIKIKLYNTEVFHY